MNLNPSCNSLLFASYSKPSDPPDPTEEKLKVISDKSLDMFLSKNQLNNRINHEQSSVEFDEDELIAQHKNAEEEFDKWKITYSDLFKNDEIKKVVSGRTFPPMIDFGMDTIEVVLSKDHPFIGTSGVATCIAVIGRGDGPHGPCLALSHTSGCGLDPEETLKRMQKKMQSKDYGCRPETIKFYVIGGKLPLFDGSCVLDSMDQERKFLSLAKQYNIVGAQFNLIDGEEGSLEIVVSADEIVWQTDLNSEDSSEDNLFNIEPSFEGFNGNDMPITDKKINLPVEKKRKRDENSDEDLQVQVKRSREEYTLCHAMNRTKDLI
ncbi:MAG: hypothetical protein H0T62_05495 [Parachlamydiaceae bacterium]|nr:hypothetical protein [Parachlamydiaceae bacterium]